MSEYLEKAQEMLKDATMEVIANYMDDDIREAVHRDIAPCKDEEFVAEYMKRHAEEYGSEFTV